MLQELQLFMLKGLIDLLRYSLHLLYRRSKLRASFILVLTGIRTPELLVITILLIYLILPHVDDDLRSLRHLIVDVGRGGEVSIVPGVFDNLRELDAFIRLNLRHSLKEV